MLNSYDNRNMSKGPVSSSSGTMRFLLNLAASTAIFVYTIGFLFFRVAEIVYLAAIYPRQCLSAFIGTGVIQCSSMGRASKRSIHLASLLGIIYTVDYYIPKPLPAPSQFYSKKTVVITGANSGLGFETARQLAVDYGMNVVMGCRSKSKCDAAAKMINNEITVIGSTGKAIPRIVDLADFQSVQSFAATLQDMNIDVLFNNAGYVPDPEVPVNEYGLDPSFTSMHLSHFLLTEELLKQKPSLRIVNTSSGTHHICAATHTLLPKFLLDIFPAEHNPGCVDEDFLKNGMYSQTDSSAYIQAKVANVMHAVEIPMHHPQATAVVIDLGWVGTSIQSFMKVSLSPTNLGMMRSVQVGVSPAMHAILSSDEDLVDDTNFVMKGREWTKDGGLLINVFGTTGEAFTFDGIWNERLNLGRSRMLELSRGLWTVSMDVIGKHVNRDVDEE